MDIENEIKNRIQEIDIRDIVAFEVKTVVKEEIYATIKRLTEQEISTIIKQEVDIVLNGAVKTDDGWGAHKEYSSFENLFKEEFAKRLNSSWDMKKMLKKAVEEKVSRLYETNKKEVIKKVVDEITKE